MGGGEMPGDELCHGIFTARKLRMRYIQPGLDRNARSPLTVS